MGSQTASRIGSQAAARCIRSARCAPSRHPSFDSRTHASCARYVRSASMISVPLLFQARNVARFIAASLRNGTVRYYVGDLPGFYQALNAAGVAYVVLRWSEHVPMTLGAEQVKADDIDHLVADRDMRRVMSIAACHPGPVKTDYYSVGGRRGSSYKSLPYYMPKLAQRILDARTLDPRGFFRPSPRDEFFAFAYHLCYHKGLSSGLGRRAACLPVGEPAYGPLRSRTSAPCCQCRVRQFA